MVRRSVTIKAGRSPCFNGECVNTTTESSSTSPGPLDVVCTSPVLLRCRILSQRSEAPHDVKQAQIRAVVFAQSSSLVPTHFVT